MDFNERGQEIPDPTPVSLPHGWERPLSLHEQIKRFIRSEMSQQAQLAGEETFEEADDFEVDEDPDPLSQYEIPEAAPEWPQGVKDEDADPPTSTPPEKSTGEAINEPERHP